MSAFDEVDGVFERSVIAYSAVVLFMFLGFVCGWALRGEQEAVPLQLCRNTALAAQNDSRVCTATLEQSWKQAREVAASAARCRESLSRAYAKEIK